MTMTRTLKWRYSLGIYVLVATILFSSAQQEMNQMGRRYDCTCNYACGERTGNVSTCYSCLMGCNQSGRLRKRIGSIASILRNPLYELEDQDLSKRNHCDCQESCDPPASFRCRSCLLGCAKLTEGNILQEMTAKRSSDITYITSVNGENNNLVQSTSPDRGTACQCLERCQVGHGCIECLKTCRQGIKQLQLVQPTIDKIAHETRSKRQPCTCNEFCPRTQTPSSGRKKSIDLPLHTNELSSDFNQVEREDGTSLQDNCLIDDFLFASNTILSSVKDSLKEVYGGGQTDSNRGCLFDCLPKDMQVELLHQVLHRNDEEEEGINQF